MIQGNLNVATRAAEEIRRYVESNAETLKALARRVARNREIAGLHYPSDSVAGRRLADAVFAVLSRHSGDGLSRGQYALPTFGEAVIAAAREFYPDLVLPPGGP